MSENLFLQQPLNLLVSIPMHVALGIYYFCQALDRVKKAAKIFPASPLMMKVILLTTVSKLSVAACLKMFVLFCRTRVQAGIS